MFARFSEFSLKVDRHEEFLKLIRNEVLPIMRKQAGFLEMLPCFSDARPEKVVVISLWDSKANAEKFHDNVSARVFDIVKPYSTPTTVAQYHVDTSLCARFAELLSAA